MGVVIKMDSKILECHKLLEETYNKAESLFCELIKIEYDATLESYNNHYLKLNGNYVCQKYYMPVITIKNKGDICFNLAKTELEFYIPKEIFLNLSSLDQLLLTYKKFLNIYEFTNCTIDIYSENDTKTSLIEKINSSNVDLFGLSVDCSSMNNEEIIYTFYDLCKLLNL